MTFSRELMRKGLHLAALVIPWGMLSLDRGATLVLLGAAAAAALLADWARARSPAIQSAVMVLFGKLMRPGEFASVPGAFVVNGATWTLVSAFFLLLVFPARIAALAMVIFLLGDAASGLVGRRYGRISWRISDRTVEGTCAFWAVALAVALIMPGTAIWIGVASALAAGAAEILPGPLDDNLQVPAAAALTVFLLELAAAANY